LDVSSRLKPNNIGRTLVSKDTEGHLFKDLKSFGPKEIASEEKGKHNTLEEEFATPGTRFVFYECARTNNHAVLAPSEEFLNDLMVAYMRQKVNVFICDIRFGLGNVVHPSNTIQSPILHLFGLLANLSMSVSLNVHRLSETSLNMRSSIMPGIEKCFVDDNTVRYMAKRGYRDYIDFLNYFSQTSTTLDYTSTQKEK
jgi:hypothetical protein